MITLNNIALKFGKQPIFENLNLTWDSNQIHGILGVNGAGKTTLFNIISGILKPESGTTLFLGRPLTNSLLSYLPSEHYFYPRITGMEYLQIFEQDQQRINDLNKLFDLPLNQFVDTYSLGMQKKLAILGAIAPDSKVYILDEPYNGLDLESCLILSRILVSLKEKGKMVLVSSHIIDPLLEICDDIVLLTRDHQSLFFEQSGFEHLNKVVLKEQIREKVELVRQIIN